jgi:serine/threonine-protein kinase
MAVDDANTGERESLLDQVLGSYLEALDAGKAPARDELLARHPELAGELAVFFADQEKISSLTAGLRQTLQPADAESTVVADKAAPDRTQAPCPALGSFGDYELLEEIGRGGMSVVYKARQKSLNRLVALKMIRADRLASDADIRRFRYEAETVAQLDHPATVPIYEVGQWSFEGIDAPLLYFSMKLIEGGDLTALCRQAPDAVNQQHVAEVLAAAARAVHHAHVHGILHRDLKPSNVLLDRDGRAHVTDFGLALRLGRDVSLTQTGAIVGTPAYMAPEQALGVKALTPAADIYGLGAILYALLTGRPPFQGANPLETLGQVKDCDPVPPSQRNRVVNRTLEAICLKCLEKEPRRRYASAGALADDLEHWLAGEATIARPEGWPGRARRVLRRRWRQAILALWVLLPLIALPLWASHLRGPSSEEEASQRQQQALEAMERNLAAGLPVQLIGAKGSPQWFRWRTTEATKAISQAADDTLTIQSWEYGLLELVPDPQCERYRLRAQVRHDHGNSLHGSAGIYFGYSGFMTDQGLRHCYGKVEFNELMNYAVVYPRWPAAGNPVNFTLHVHLEPSMVTHGSGPPPLEFFRPAAHLGGEGWRDLAVEVRPSGIRFFWEGRHVKSLSQAELRQLAKMLAKGLADPAPEFAPRGGMGLYVYTSAASFRNVVLEPLGDVKDEP